MTTPPPDEPEDDVYRVYRREWVVVYTTKTRESADAHIDSQYTGRIRPHEARIVDDYYVYRVTLLLPCLKGEYTGRSRAEAFAHDLIEREPFGGEYLLVRRNSPRDHELRNYGVKKLRDG